MPIYCRHEYNGEEGGYLLWEWKWIKGELLVNALIIAVASKIIEKEYSILGNGAKINEFTEEKG